MKNLTQLALAIATISTLAIGSLVAAEPAAKPTKDASVNCPTMSLTTGPRQGNIVTVVCDKNTAKTPACRTACERNAK